MTRQCLPGEEGASWAGGGEGGKERAQGPPGRPSAVRAVLRGGGGAARRCATAVHANFLRAAARP